MHFASSCFILCGMIVFLTANQNDDLVLSARHPKSYLKQSERSNVANEGQRTISSALNSPVLKEKRSTTGTELDSKNVKQPQEKSDANAGPSQKGEYLVRKLESYKSASKKQAPINNLNSAREASLLDRREKDEIKARDTLEEFEGKERKFRKRQGGWLQGAGIGSSSDGSKNTVDFDNWKVGGGSDSDESDDDRYTYYSGYSEDYGTSYYYMHFKNYDGDDYNSGSGLI